MNPWQISRKIGQFALDQRFIGWLIALAVVVAGWSWLRENPQHNPFAPLDTRHPPGFATKMKLGDAIESRGSCLAALSRSDVRFEALSAAGEGPCARLDRTRLLDAPLSPARPLATCSVLAGLEIWLEHGLQQAAQQHLGSRVTRIEHIGTHSCRRVGGGRSGPWSEHARGNAIDIRAFVLEDGRRISVSGGWGNGNEGEFLRAARTAACESFENVLSPDYNADHSDHFHLDQGTRWASICR